MMCGAHIRVSTLLTTVGRPKTPPPTWKGCGGRVRGCAPLALQGLHQGRLLAADVGPGPAVDVDVQLVVGAEDALAQEARLAGLPHRPLQHLEPVQVLAPDIDVGGVGVDGEGADDHPLQEHVGVAVHRDAVGEAPRLRLVGVDHQVAGAGVAARPAPLDPGREAGPAPAPQLGVGDHLDDLLGRHRGHRLARAVVAPPGPVVGHRPGVGLPHRHGQDRLEGEGVPTPSPVGRCSPPLPGSLAALARPWRGPGSLDWGGGPGARAAPDG